MKQNTYRINTSKFYTEYDKFLTIYNDFSNTSFPKLKIQTFLIFQNNLLQLRKILLKIMNISLENNSITLWDIAEFRNKSLFEYENKLSEKSPNINKKTWDYCMQFDLLYQYYKIYSCEDYDLTDQIKNPFNNLSREETLKIIQSLDLRYLSSKKDKNYFKSFKYDTTKKKINTLSEKDFSELLYKTEELLIDQLFKKFYSFMIKDSRLKTFFNKLSSQTICINTKLEENPLIENYKSTKNIENNISDFPSSKSDIQKYYEGIFNFYGLSLTLLDLDKKSILDNVPPKYKPFVSLIVSFLIINSEREKHLVNYCIQKPIKKTDYNEMNQNDTWNFISKYFPKSFILSDLYPHAPLNIKFIENNTEKNNINYLPSIQNIIINNNMYHRLILNREIFSIENFCNLELISDTSTNNITINNESISIDIPIIVMKPIEFSLQKRNNNNTIIYKISILPTTCYTEKNSLNGEFFRNFALNKDTSSDFSLRELFSENSYYITHNILELFYYYFSRAYLII